MTDNRPGIYLAGQKPDLSISIPLRDPRWIATPNSIPSHSIAGACKSLCWCKYVVPSETAGELIALSVKGYAECTD